MLRRIERAEDFLLDPAFELPAAFVAEVDAAAYKFDLSEVHSHPSHTPGDHQFELLEPALARCSPAALAQLLRRKLRDHPPADARYWRAIHAPSALLLTEEKDAQAALDLRLAPGAHPDTASEMWARTCLLLLEMWDSRAQSKPGASSPRILITCGATFCQCWSR